MGILWPCWISLATITSRKLSTALRSPVPSGIQTSRCSGDSGWSMKTSAKVSDELVSGFNIPSRYGCLGANLGPRPKKSVSEGLIQMLPQCSVPIHKMAKVGGFGETLDTGWGCKCMVTVFVIMDRVL